MLKNVIRSVSMLALALPLMATITDVPTCHGSGVASSDSADVTISGLNCTGANLFVVGLVMLPVGQNGGGVAHDGTANSLAFQYAAITVTDSGGATWEPSNLYDRLSFSTSGAETFYTTGAVTGTSSHSFTVHIGGIPVKAAALIKGFATTGSTHIERDRNLGAEMIGSSRSEGGYHSASGTWPTETFVRNPRPGQLTINLLQFEDTCTASFLNGTRTVSDQVNPGAHNVGGALGWSIRASSIDEIDGWVFSNPQQWISNSRLVLVE